MQTFKVGQGDSWVSIAQKVFGDGRRYAEIMNANGGGILHPNDIVYIPDIDTSKKAVVTDADIAKANSLQAVADGYNGKKKPDAGYMATREQLQAAYNANGPKKTVDPIALENSNFVNYKKGLIQTGSMGAGVTNKPNAADGANANPTGSNMTPVQELVYFHGTPVNNNPISMPKQTNKSLVGQPNGLHAKNLDPNAGVEMPILRQGPGGKSYIPGAARYNPAPTQQAIKNSPLYNGQRRLESDQAYSKIGLPTFGLDQATLDVHDQIYRNVAAGMPISAEDLMALANGDEISAQQIIDDFKLKQDPLTGQLISTEPTEESLAEQDFNMYMFAESLGVPHYQTPDWLLEYYNGGGGDGGGGGSEKGSGVDPFVSGTLQLSTG